MNIQLSGYWEYYKVSMCNRICNYNKGMIKNWFFGVGDWGYGRLASGFFLLCSSDGGLKSTRQRKTQVHYTLAHMGVRGGYLQRLRQQYREGQGRLQEDSVLRGAGKISLLSVLLGRHLLHRQLEIISMFRWYRKVSRSYVYLSDFSITDHKQESEQLQCPCFPQE
jgi:hypothetical protein